MWQHSSYAKRIVVVTGDTDDILDYYRCPFTRPEMTAARPCQRRLCSGAMRKDASLNFYQIK